MELSKHENKNKKRYHGCLAHVVRGVFYSVVAHRRQPNLYLPSTLVYERGGGGIHHIFVDLWKCQFFVCLVSIIRNIDMTTPDTVQTDSTIVAHCHNAA